MFVPGDPFCFAPVPKKVRSAPATRRWSPSADLLPLPAVLPTLLLRPTSSPEWPACTGCSPRSALHSRARCPVVLQHSERTPDVPLLFGSGLLADRLLRADSRCRRIKRFGHVDARGSSGRRLVKVLRAFTPGAKVRKCAPDIRSLHPNSSFPMKRMSSFVQRAMTRPLHQYERQRPVRNSQRWVFWLLVVFLDASAVALSAGK